MIAQDDGNYEKPGCLGDFASHVSQREIRRSASVKAMFGKAMKSLFPILLFSLFALVSEAHELDQHARVLDSPLPVYPSSDQGNEADQGIVSIVFEIDTKGAAKVVRVMCSSSYRFAEAARSVAPRWKFSPGTRDGKVSGDVLEFILFFSPGKEVQIVGPLYKS
jgi:hypothetical protein